MAITLTNLTAAVGVNDQSITVASATGFAVGNVIRLDSEDMVQIGAAVGLVIPVRRGGQNGTAQTSHLTLAPVTTGLSADFPLPRPGQVLNPHYAGKVIQTVAADATITYPAVDTIFYITKATACLISLLSPTAGCPDGVEVIFYSTTAAAHVLTYLPGFNGNTTSSDVGTYAATIGNNLTMISSKGLVGLTGNIGVTVA